MKDTVWSDEEVLDKAVLVPKDGNSVRQYLKYAGYSKKQIEYLFKFDEGKDCSDFSGIVLKTVRLIAAKAHIENKLTELIKSLKW